ncbi:hypothetical protein [Halorubrum coriense]|uniref:hypothetical protein n=1 Tax=Halorubrum coriense TaxID=64713 RepID=UPI0006778828|nr:hypothetical protein [Halorubrum coriense]
MASRNGGSADTLLPVAGSHRPPIKLLGGVLWSLVIVLFVVLWRVGNFADAPPHLLTNAEMIGQVVGVLAVFLLTVPVVFALCRGRSDTETKDVRGTPDEYSGNNTSSENGDHTGQGSLNSTYSHR